MDAPTNSRHPPRSTRCPNAHTNEQSDQFFHRGIALRRDPTAPPPHDQADFRSPDPNCCLERETQGARFLHAHTGGLTCVPNNAPESYDLANRGRLGTACYGAVCRFKPLGC